MNFGDNKNGARVYLIGDAAHIHPPAGGRGMKFDLQHGVSLGPVIAATLTADTSAGKDETVRAHVALRQERATKVIGVANVWRCRPVRERSFGGRRLTSSLCVARCSRCWASRDGLRIRSHTGSVILSTSCLHLYALRSAI